MLNYIQLKKFEKQVQIQNLLPSAVHNLNLKQPGNASLEFQIASLVIPLHVMQNLKYFMQKGS